MVNKNILQNGRKRCIRFKQTKTICKVIKRAEKVDEGIFWTFIYFDEGYVYSLNGIHFQQKASAKTEKPDQKDEVEKEEKLEGGKIKHGKVMKKRIKPRGLVYLSHIPHGFYEVSVININV